MWHNNTDPYLPLLVPYKEFNFSIARVGSNETSLNMTCYASQLYPEPILTLSRYANSSETELIASDATVIREESGQYSVWLTSIINDDDLTPSDVADHYQCSLQLPNTEYVVNITRAVQAGKSGSE